MEKKPAQILYVCTNFRSGAHSSCAARGSRQVLATIKAAVLARGMDLKVEPIVCLGECDKGPNMRFAGREILNGVGPDDIDAILNLALSSLPGDAAS